MGWAWRKEGEVEWGGGWGFYSETANPPIKRVLFNNARQFPEVGLTPPLFYKEMIFHTQTSLIGCSRGGERALEDMKMVSFSFLLRFGSPSPFYNSSLNLIFILNSRFLQAIKSLEVIECCVWFERGKLYFLHTPTHLFLLLDPGDDIRSLNVTQPKLRKPWWVNPTGSLVQTQLFQNPRGGIFTVQIKAITSILNAKKILSCTQCAFYLYSEFPALPSVPLNKPAYPPPCVLSES